MQHYIKQHPTNASEPPRLKNSRTRVSDNTHKVYKMWYPAVSQTQLNIAYNT